MAVSVECTPGSGECNNDGLAKAVANEIRKHILVRSEVKILGPGELPRSFAKTKRVQDERGDD
jgi:phenylacetate-CoA ligase